ncbi:MAG: metal-dependent phosphohydrolase, partial [Bacteroidota bacterium]|nr:metal-dependent phosphohydrolase [Bacteroidota bacterium]
VLEDTSVSEHELKIFLKEIMDPKLADRTLQLVMDLTDVYIKEDFPELNREKRKNKEAERLMKASPDAQTVKYADSIDNTVDITKNNKEFAKKFLPEVQFLLSKMDKGIPELYEKSKKTLKDCFKELKNKKKTKG